MPKLLIQLIHTLANLCDRIPKTGKGVDVAGGKGLGGIGMESH